MTNENEQETGTMPVVQIKNLVKPLTIRVWPDPVLRVKCEEIEEVTDWHKELAGRMVGKMKTPGTLTVGAHQLIIEPGIGLSAPQVGHSVSMLVVETGKEGEAAAIINPKIIFRGKKSVVMEEGCLSFPGYSAKIKRPTQVVIQARTLSGDPVEIEADGNQARVLQHEIDHLNGVLFIDKISLTGRRKLKKYLARLREIYEAHKEPKAKV